MYSRYGSDNALCVVWWHVMKIHVYVHDLTQILNIPFMLKPSHKPSIERRCRRIQYRILFAACMKSAFPRAASCCTTASCLVVVVVVIVADVAAAGVEQGCCYFCLLLLASAALNASAHSCMYRK